MSFFFLKIKKPSWYTCLMMSKKTKVLLLRTEDTKLTKKSPKLQTTPNNPNPTRNKVRLVKPKLKECDY